MRSSSLSRIAFVADVEKLIGEQRLMAIEIKDAGFVGHHFGLLERDEFRPGHSLPR